MYPSVISSAVDSHSKFGLTRTLSSLKRNGIDLSKPKETENKEYKTKQISFCHRQSPGLRWLLFSRSECNKISHVNNWNETKISRAERYCSFQWKMQQKSTEQNKHKRKDQYCQKIHLMWKDNETKEERWSSQYWNKMTQRFFTHSMWHVCGEL